MSEEYEEKEPNKVEVVLLLKRNGQMTNVLTVDQLCDLLKIDRGLIDAVDVTIEKDKERLTAVTNVDPHYPGIAIEGRDSRGNPLYLTDAELPNETFPNHIAVRVYAGYIEQFELEEPMARVITNIRDEEDFEKRVTAAETDKPYYDRKVIYVDYEVARIENDKYYDSKNPPTKEHDA